MIDVQSLTRSYGMRTAVDNVSFQIGRGEVVGFLGPNGAGKTTTMRMLTCFLPPSSGSASICGFDIVEESYEVRSRIGYLPESVPLYGDMVVGEYLRYVATLKGVENTELHRRVGSAAERCGIQEVHGQRISELSRGYRQRVGIAQAIVNNPDVLILDEPTVGLDPRQIVEIRDLIRAMAGERTVVLSSHILPEVSRVCERVLIIHKGCLVFDGPTSDGYARSGRPEIVVTFRGDPRTAIDRVSGLPGVTEVSTAHQPHHLDRLEITPEPESDPRASITASLVEAGIDVLEITSREETLEDVFVRLVSGEARAG